MNKQMKTLLVRAALLAGMVLTSLNLGGCFQGGYGYPGYYPPQPINVQPGNGYHHSGQAVANNGAVPAIAALPTVASNEANYFVGNNPMSLEVTGGMTAQVQHEPDGNPRRPIWYRICIGAVCTQPSADGLPLGSNVGGSWIGLVPPHGYAGGPRMEETGMIRPGNNIPVDVDCYTGATARQLVRVGGFTVPGGINIPGTFQANFTLAERFCR